MKNIKKTITLCTILTAGTAHAEFMFGLTNEKLLTTFDSSTPGTLSAGITLTGVAPGETIRSIDYRPSNGNLYALSSFSSISAGTASIYTVNKNTGVLTQIVKAP